MLAASSISAANRDFVAMLDDWIFRRSAGISQWYRDARTLAELDAPGVERARSRTIML